MKTSIQIIFLAFLSTALAHAQTPFGSWKIYHAQGDRVFMVQTVSTTSPAKLDVICRRGRLSAIAIEPDLTMDETALSFTAVVPTASLAFTLDDESRSEKWAVVDDGHSLTPYSELSQKKLNRSWVSRISSSKKMQVRLAGIAGEMNGQPSFETENLTQALSSIGCSY